MSLNISTATATGLIVDPTVYGRTSTAPVELVNIVVSETVGTSQITVVFTVGGASGQLLYTVVAKGNTVDLHDLDTICNGGVYVTITGAGTAAVSVAWK